MSDSSGVRAGRRPGQTLGQHRLARTGRAHHEQVVPTGGRDFEGVAPEGLSPDIGQIGRVGRRQRRAARAGWPASRSGAQDLRQLGQRRHAMGRVAPDQGGLADVAQRHDQLRAAPWRRPGRSCPGTWRNEPLRPSSPQKASAVRAVRWELAGGHQHPDGDGQVEAGASFSHARRRQIDVTRRRGQGSPLESRAARTRSRDSRTAASGRPTMVKPGSPLETWTSTETGWPTAPVKVAAGDGGEHAEERSPSRRPLPGRIRDAVLHWG